MHPFDHERALKLDQLKKSESYRSRSISDSAQTIHQTINGNAIINFASNNYLGLANHSKIKSAFKKALDQWGVGSGAAHLINGHSRAHHRLEDELAEFTNYPRALLFSSGYVANLALLTSLYGKDTTLYQDKLNHASLIDAGLSSEAQLKRYKHNDMPHLDALISKNTQQKAAIVSDGVFSMDGDTANLNELIRVAKKYQAEVIIDDAHGFGVLGKNGAGICEHLSISQHDAPIYMATLGKAAGCFGAFVCGSDILIETLINQARSYIYTTATPPALAEATRTSITIIKNESWRREKLRANIDFFKQYAVTLGISILNSDTAIQGIIIGSNEKVIRCKDYLFEQGFLVGAIRAPTVLKTTERLRITLSCDHDTNDIKVLLDLYENFR